jgi:exopolysaccharide production protein ExoQ
MIKGLRAQRNSVSHYIAATVYILWTSSAIGYIDTVVYGSWPGKSGTKLSESINLLGVATSLILFYWGTRRRHPHLNLIPPLMVVSVVVCSVLWSVDPITTITRGIAYLFLLVGAIGLVKTIQANELMRLTASISGVLALVSLLLFIAARDGSGGDFSGVFPQKNVLGQAMAIGVLAGLHVVRTGEAKLRYVGIIAICTIVGILSKSTTALLVIMTFFTLHILLALYVGGGVRRTASVVLMIILASIAIFVTGNKDMLFNLLDKDPSLTGRTELWPYVADAIMQRPLLGWGFAAFWSPLNAYSVEISDAIHWHVTEAHNGLLQVLLDVGMVGAAFFLFMLARNLTMAVKCIRGRAPEIGITLLLFLVGVLVIGVSEQVLVVVDGWTAQFFMLGLMCEQALRSRTALVSASIRRELSHSN